MTNKGMTKEKKQLALLGGLAVVLVAVVAIPFGEADGDGSGGGEAPAPAAVAPAPSAGPSVPQMPPAPAVNPALRSGPDGEQDAEFRSPFESLWALTEPVETRVDDLPPPTVTLNGTLTSGRTPVAVINGQTRFQGDSIQGWTLEIIGSREITLRSPNRNTVKISMPLLQGEGRRLPADGR